MITTDTPKDTLRKAEHRVGNTSMLVGDIPSRRNNRSIIGGRCGKGRSWHEDLYNWGGPNWPPRLPSVTARPRPAGRRRAYCARSSPAKDSTNPPRSPRSAAAARPAFSTGSRCCVRVASKGCSSATSQDHARATSICSKANHASNSNCNKACGKAAGRPHPS